MKVPIYCPNCDTINNVNREELALGDGEILFDCGKCNAEVLVEITLSFTEDENEEEEKEGE